MYEHYNILIPLCSLIQTHPEFFYDNIEVGAVFGNFQFCCWDGGRVFSTERYRHATREEIEKLKHIYNKELNIPMRLIFTTALENPDICDSQFDNFVSYLCEDEMNEIVIVSKVLEDYLRKNYPKYSFISSTTKCLTSPEEAKNEIIDKNYKMICLDYNLNKNKKFLATIPADDRKKVEFLINAICPPGCPSRKKHYKLNSLFNYTYGKHYSTGECGIKRNTLYPNNYKNNFTMDEIIEYNKQGFEYFKIEGRTFDTLTLTLELVKFLVKPEYQFYIAEFLLRFSEDFDLNEYSLEKFKTIII